MGRPPEKLTKKSMKTIYSVIYTDVFNHSIERIDTEDMEKALEIKLNLQQEGHENIQIQSGIYI